MRLLHSLSPCLLASALLVTPLPGSPQEPVNLEEQRAVWEQLEPQMRATALARFGELKSMTPAERAAFDRRATALAQVRGQVERGLSPDDRQALEALLPPERSRVVRDHVREELGMRGSLVRGLLPARVRKELESARGPRLHSFLAGHRERQCERVGRDVARALGRPEELERLKSMPPDQRAQETLALMAELAASSLEAEADGRPQGLAEEEWGMLKSLPPDDFLRELDLHGLRPKRHMPWRHTPPPGGREHQSPPPEEIDKQRGLTLLLEATHPKFADQLSTRGLLDGERSQALEALVVERLRSLLNEHPQLLNREQLDALDDLSGRALIHSLRSAVHANRDSYHQRFGPPPGVRRGNTRFGEHPPGRGPGRPPGRARSPKEAPPSPGTPPPLGRD